MIIDKASVRSDMVFIFIIVQPGYGLLAKSRVPRGSIQPIDPSARRWTTFKPRCPVFRNISIVKPPNSSRITAFNSQNLDTVRGSATTGKDLHHHLLNQIGRHRHKLPLARHQNYLLGLLKCPDDFSIVFCAGESFFSMFIAASSAACASKARPVTQVPYAVIMQPCFHGETKSAFQA